MSGIWKWGYKPDGESCLFELPAGSTPLPDGWSDDVMVIIDPNKRTAEAITAASGTSATTPVKVASPEEGNTERRPAMPRTRAEKN